MTFTAKTLSAIKFTKNDLYRENIYSENIYRDVCNQLNNNNIYYSFSIVATTTKI